MTYTIGNDSRSITCHTCGRMSQHLSDVANLYCGFCHKFHDDEREAERIALRELVAARDEERNAGCIQEQHRAARRLQTAWEHARKLIRTRT